MNLSGILESINFFKHSYSELNNLILNLSILKFLETLLYTFFRKIHF